MHPPSRSTLMMANALLLAGLAAALTWHRSPAPAAPSRATAALGDASNSLPISVSPGLAAAFEGVALAQGAGRDGEGAASPRLRGNYLLVAGRIQGGSQSVVYVLDVVNQELAALRWNRAAQRMESLGFRSLTRDLPRGAPDFDSTGPTLPAGPETPDNTGGDR